MSQIVFNITLVADNVKHAMKLKKDLIEAGEGVEISVANRVNAPVVPTSASGKGPHELAFLRANPDQKQFRLSSGMVYLIDSLKQQDGQAKPETKDAYIGAFVAYQKAQRIVKTVSGYALSGGNVRSNDNDIADTSGIGEIDENEVV